MKKQYSGKQIIKVGETLLNDDFLQDDKLFLSTMDTLSFWRYSHNTPLENAFSLLHKISIKKDKNAIFAKRLKRYSSIILKLRRFPDMKLKNMQDIGGCRAIISTEKKVFQIVRELKKLPEFKNAGKVRFKNYIEEPKEDGYRSYHIIGKFYDNDKKQKNIEIQLRTHIQHYWATALEIVDLFTDQALKSNQGQEEWKIFFNNLSKQFSFMENIHMFNTLHKDKKTKYFKNTIESNKEAKDSCKLTQKYCKKLNVIKKLTAFAQSINIIEDQLNNSEIETGFILLKINTKESTVTSTIFEKEENNIAEKEYINEEKASVDNQDIVVALVSTTSLGDIKEAYPNYFADSTKFLEHLSIVMNMSVSGLYNKFF